MRHTFAAHVRGLVQHHHQGDGQAATLGDALAGRGQLDAVRALSTDRP